MSTILVQIHSCGTVKQKTEECAYF